VSLSYAKVCENEVNYPDIFASQGEKRIHYNCNNANADSSDEGEYDLICQLSGKQVNLFHQLHLEHDGEQTEDTLAQPTRDDNQWKMHKGEFEEGAWNTGERVQRHCLWGAVKTKRAAFMSAIYSSEGTICIVQTTR
jgi:hypothetical protein